MDLLLGSHDDWSRRKVLAFGESGGKIGRYAISSDFFREALILGILVGVIVSLSPVSVLSIITTAMFVLVGSLLPDNYQGRPFCNDYFC